MLDGPTRQLRPVAIQLAPQGTDDKHWPVFTPRDELDWLAAKAAVQAADATVHETQSHLARTHLVQEAFCLALHNCLSARHPLYRLMAPHFEGTLNINNAADSLLVDPGGFVDALLLPTIGGSIQLAADALADFDFAASVFPKQLEARGVADADLFPDYPYRDDGRLVWAALERWVGGFIDQVYADDAAVVSDPELQAFVRQVGEKGKLKGVSDASGGVATKAWLKTMVTQILWNGSAEHAAVNFPQAGPMSYAPNQPLALMGAPDGITPTTMERYLAMLPQASSAQLQVFILGLLGGVHHTTLGDYPVGWFGTDLLHRDPIHTRMRALQADLAAVEDQIRLRNTRRTRYPYLLPSNIPQSINI